MSGVIIRCLGHPVRFIERGYELTAPEKATLFPTLEAATRKAVETSMKFHQITFEPTTGKEKTNDQHEQRVQAGT